MQPDGSRPEVKGSTDKRVTEQLAAKAETDAARARAGIVDHFESHRNRPIGEHVDEYLAFQIEGWNGQAVDLTETRIRAVIAGCGFRKVSKTWTARRRRMAIIRRKAEKTKAREDSRDHCPNLEPLPDRHPRIHGLARPTPPNGSQSAGLARSAQCET